MTKRTGFQSDSDGQVSLPNSGRPQQQDIVRISNEPPGGQFLDRLDVNRWLKLEVEALKRLLKREASHRCFHLGMTFLLGNQFSIYQLLEEIGIGEFAFTRFLQQRRQFGRRSGKLETLHSLLEAFQCR